MTARASSIAKTDRIARGRSSSSELPGSIFGAMVEDGFEQVVHCHDRGSGLRAIIVIHDTALGPALGGVRMHPYDSEAAALLDCMRLAQGMTLKAAAAGVNLGGGKSVIIGDPVRDKSEALLRAMGRFIESLGGRYIPGIDVGTDMSDLEIIGVEASRVSCVKGDPSPVTALGVLEGIRTCVQRVRGSAELQGVTVCVQGVGHVGSSLARLLDAEGAVVSIADVDPARARTVADALGATVIEPSAVISADVDVYAPCAMGGVISDATVGELRCSIVAGGANNVLDTPAVGADLHERGILYAPDFCINAGGLIFLEEEMLKHDETQTERRVRRVGQLVADVIDRAMADRIPTSEAAIRIAHDRLANLGRVGPPYLG